MGVLKVHVHKGLKAYFVSKGRKWVVEEGEQTHQFSNVNEVVRKFPQLLEVNAIIMACERKKTAKLKAVLPEIKAKKPEPVLTKTVSCYYCSGKGDIFDGVLCPNCKGQGIFEVNTRGIG